MGRVGRLGFARDHELRKGGLGQTKKGPWHQAQVGGLYAAGNHWRQWSVCLKANRGKGASVCAGSVGHWSHRSCLQARGEGQYSETVQRGHLGDGTVQGVRRQEAWDFCLTVNMPVQMLSHRLSCLFFEVNLTLYTLIPFPFYKRKLRFGRLNTSPKTQVTCTRKLLSQGWDSGLSDSHYSDGPPWNRTC